MEEKKGDSAENVWAEDLPNGCPLEREKAFEPKDFKVYRLAKRPKIDGKDFDSQRAIAIRKKKPNKKFGNIPECIVCSLSVYNKAEVCWDMLKLPTFKNRWKALLEIVLNKEEGMVEKTFEHPNHYSWWRTAAFSLDKSIILTQDEQDT